MEADTAAEDLNVDFVESSGLQFQPLGTWPFLKPFYRFFEEFHR